MCQLASAGAGYVCVKAESSVWRKVEMEPGQDI